jgi:RimJ/RimL family protein N-acetyltransferase
MPAALGLPDHIPGGAHRRSGLQIRQLTPADRDRLAEAFARLSDRTRYLRFHTPKPRLSSAELTYFTEIDHTTHEALVAVEPEEQRLVGVARYAPVHGEPATADFAIVVADEWQGRGVGGRLARDLLARAAANGVRRITASTLEENRAARRTLRGLGFRTRGFAGGVVEMDLALAAPA